MKGEGRMGMGKLGKDMAKCIKEDVAKQKTIKKIVKRWK
jgi:hypothetical protein